MGPPFHSRFSNPISTHSSRREIDRWSMSRRNMGLYSVLGNEESSYASPPNRWHQWGNQHRPEIVPSVISGTSGTFVPGKMSPCPRHRSGANAAHGYRRTSEDKRRAVMTLLDDPIWAHWNNMEIARHRRSRGDGQELATKIIFANYEDRRSARSQSERPRRRDYRKTPSHRFSWRRHLRPITRR
jgi:hypothetical protein